MPLFDDENLVSCVGLVPVMGLAEQAGLSELIVERVALDSLGSTRVASATVNPVGKLTSIIAGMAADADSIDDLDVIRSGGMPRLFEQVYAPATLGQFLREFTHGHTRQLAAVARTHLVNLAARTDLLPGIETRAFIDIDSLLRPVYGHAKQGASFGHTKIAGKQVLRRGLSPLATTISTDHDTGGAPVVAGIRLRAGKAGSGKGAASMVTEAIGVARAAGATGEILVRGDSAYGTSAVVAACLKAKVRFSVVLTKNPAVTAAIDTIAGDAWTPVHYPGAVVDPDTGELIAQADITHRRHAIIETVFADLIDGPLAHLPSGLFAANSAWVICAQITHNLLRAAGTLTSPRHAVARGATLRRHIINVPARIARPQRRRVLHLPAHWPWAQQWNALWHNVFCHDTAPPLAA